MPRNDLKNVQRIEENLLLIVGQALVLKIYLFQHVEPFMILQMIQMNRIFIDVDYDKDCLIFAFVSQKFPSCVFVNRSRHEA